ncbi:MAG TPA: STAS domain-containing protein [Burkholderiaceae bacterium]|jgi:rsbT co-antagonist protein RsbR|nr:STAS domain-containing protein [Burkholderiaceae bacterium]
MNQALQSLLDVLSSDPTRMQREWLAESSSAGSSGAASATAAQDAREIFDALTGALRAGADPERFDDAGWDRLRSALADLSGSRAAQGSSAGETSQFVMAIKRPLFTGLRKHTGDDAQRLFEATWAASLLADKMAQWTATSYQHSREDVIRRQQEELLELSTPVVKLWEGVLAVPMIGTLDSSRTQLVMESLLQRIVETGSELAIIDITGVPTVDTLVAQHLLKTVTAIRLMGADCIISGIRPQIAQTIVHLGIDLQGITTKATLADALSVALKRSGFVVKREA